MSRKSSNALIPLGEKKGSASIGRNSFHKGYGAQLPHDPIVLLIPAEKPHHAEEIPMLPCIGLFVVDETKVVPLADLQQFGKIAFVTSIYGKSWLTDLAAVSDFADAELN